MSRMLTRTRASGSYGAMTGASTATSTAAPSMTAPTSPIRLRMKPRIQRRALTVTPGGGAVASVARLIGPLRLADPWVEPAVHELGRQVGDHDRDGDDEERALEDRVVALTDRLDGELP